MNEDVIKALNFLSSSHHYLQVDLLKRDDFKIAQSLESIAYWAQIALDRLRAPEVESLFSNAPGKYAPGFNDAALPEKVQP